MQTKYYVTMKRDSRTAWLLGPFDTKAEALDKVETARAVASSLDPWSHFDAFGTSSVTGERFPQGRLNDLVANNT